MKRAFPLFLVAWASACGGKPADPDPLPFAAASASAAPDPAALGPFPVGVRTLEILDSGRKKPDGSPRRLITEVWYPAEQASRGGPGATYDIRTLFTPEQQLELAGATVPALETPAVRDAPPAKTHGPFPLIIFSHGQAAMRWQSTYLTVYLASHGYVVASPDHEGGLLSDVLRSQLQAPTEGIDLRPQDVRYLITRLGRLPAEDPLAPLVDPTGPVGVCGHSFGAVTSMRVAPLDARVKAIVPQAPANADLAWLGLPQPVAMNIPVQLQGARLDKTLEWDENVAPAWAALKAPRELLELTRGGHFTFSDICQFDLIALAKQVTLNVSWADLEKVLKDGCGTTNIPASVAQPLMRHFAIGFFNLHLKASPGSADHLTQSAADGFGAGEAVFTRDP